MAIAYKIGTGTDSGEFRSHQWEGSSEAALQHYDSLRWTQEHCSSNRQGKPLAAHSVQHSAHIHHL